MLLQRIRVCAVIMIACSVFVGVGCGKDSGKPNPDLKIPEIPTGGRDSKGSVLSKPGS